MPLGGRSTRWLRCTPQHRNPILHAVERRTLKSSDEALDLLPEVVHLLNLARQAEILPGYLGTMSLTSSADAG